MAVASGRARPNRAFTHHTGHAGTHLRGSSDLEAYWESKITLRRDGGQVELSAEHRGSRGWSVAYRLAWHEASRSMRLDAVDAADRDQALARHTPGTSSSAPPTHARACDWTLTDAPASLPPVRSPDPVGFVLLPSWPAHLGARKPGGSKVREAVLDRDRHHCTRCGIPAAIVHHIVPISEGGTNDPANMVTLCFTCHRAEHVANPV